jgi:hypothetical protein
VKKYHVAITSLTPLLMHRDDIESADLLQEWRDDPENRKYKKAGDDRTPPWTWIGYLYHDGSRLALPAENLTSCFMRGAAKVPVPGGRGGKTFKAQAVSGMAVVDAFIPLRVKNKEIPYAEIYPGLKTERTFDAHKRKAEELGFSLYVRRAKIANNKHVRVRPRFDEWSAEFDIDVWDDQISDRALRDILTSASRSQGLGDWRPGSPMSPGPFGRFSVELS